jgi:5-methylcytosine-specific restriction endonuclease McrA
MILAHDGSQIEYYEEITKQIPGRVLSKHGIVQRDGNSYILEGFQTLSPGQVKDLLELCQAKLNEYIAKRGKRIWQHRKLSSGLISGSLKFEVLKRAKTRCEACGASNEEKALEVDHIVPRNKGGTDDLSNLQALCYSCNSMKRDRDATDFHKIRQSYGHREPGCLFCEIQDKSAVMENELAFVI